jgi:hypothetical protein
MCTSLIVRSLSSIYLIRTSFCRWSDFLFISLPFSDVEGSLLIRLRLHPHRIPHLHLPTRPHRLIPLEIEELC